MRMYVAIESDVLNIHVYFALYTQLFDNLQIQVANTQWILIVELHQFHNFYNAEMSSNEFCCCDSSESCVLDASKLQDCVENCDTWFTAEVSQCMQYYTCSFFTPILVDTPPIINLKNKFIFVLTSYPDFVSVSV